MDMAGQPRLFDLAVEAGNIQILWEHPHGWSVHITTRRQGSAWGDEPAEFYSALSTSELVDVISASLSGLLGL